jgi:hypothetical protein
MSRRNTESEETAERMRGWIDEAKQLLPQLKNCCAQHSEFGRRAGPKLASKFIDEATYFLRLALRFPPDWPEYQEFAADLDKLIDDARELIV